MDNLRLVENDLIPVYETDTTDKVIYGTELYNVLGVKSRFNDWVKNRLNDCGALENEDFEPFTKNLVNGGQSRDYIIKLDTAKEMAMLERNEKGKQVRRYFIELEKKYKNMPRVPVTMMPPTPNPIQDLSPQLQLLINMELKLKGQDAKFSILEDRAEKQTEAIQTVKEALAIDMEQGFSHWVSESIKKIAESHSFAEKPYRYQSAWGESYRRLMVKAGCNLDTQLKNAKKRAAENGATKNQIKNISKLSIVESNKRLKELYISCIREMMVAYCVEVA